MEKAQQKLQVGSGSCTSSAATPSPAPPRDSVPVPPRSKPRSAQSPSQTARTVTSRPRGAPCSGHEAIAAVLLRRRFISGCGRRGYIKWRRQSVPAAVMQSRRHAGALSSAQLSSARSAAAARPPGRCRRAGPPPRYGGRERRESARKRSGAPRARGCYGLRRVALHLPWEGGDGGVGVG